MVHSANLFLTDFLRTALATILVSLETLEWHLRLWDYLGPKHFSGLTFLSLWILVPQSIHFIYIVSKKNNSCSKMTSPDLENFARGASLQYASFHVRDKVDMHVVYGPRKLAWVSLQLPSCDVLTCEDGMVTAILHFDSFSGCGLPALRSFFSRASSQPETEPNAGAMCLAEAEEEVMLLG